MTKQDLITDSSSYSPPTRRRKSRPRGKLRGVYVAADELGFALARYHGVHAREIAPVLDALRGLISEANETADSYDDSGDSIEESFASSPTADDCREKADALRASADELDGVLERGQGEAVADWVTRIHGLLAEGCPV